MPGRSLGFGQQLLFGDLHGAEQRLLPLGQPLAVKDQSLHIDLAHPQAVGQPGDVGIHGELAHTWTDGGRNDAYLQYIFGIDYTFADIRPGQNLRLLLEYAGEHVTRKGRRLDGVPPTRLGRHLDHSILGRAVYELNESTALELKACLNLEGGKNCYLQPSLKYDISDDLRLTVGADIFSGSGNTFFGQFDKNDRFFLILEYHF